MPIFRADYLIKPDLVIYGEELVPPISTKNNFQISFKNSDKNNAGQYTRLLASVIGEAENIDNVQSVFKNELACALDIMTFSSHSRFEILCPMRIIDWVPHQRKRNFKILLKSDTRDPPDPELHKDLLITVSEIEKLDIHSYIRTALKYFRYGVIENSPDDQFIKFWMALEILGENSKDSVKEAIKCAHCNSALVCKCCNESIEKVPMAKAQITKLIGGLYGHENAIVISKRLFKVRDALMHGGSIDSIERKLKLTIDSVIDEIASVVWNLIYNLIEGLPSKPLAFGHRGGNFTNQSLLMSTNGSFEYDGVDPHPTDEIIYGMKLSVITNFISKN